MTPACTRRDAATTCRACRAPSAASPRESPPARPCELAQGGSGILLAPRLPTPTSIRRPRFVLHRGPPAIRLAGCNSTRKNARHRGDTAHPYPVVLRAALKVAVERRNAPGRLPWCGRSGRASGIALPKAEVHRTRDGYGWSPRFVQSGWIADRFEPVANDGKTFAVMLGALEAVVVTLPP
jgi:hypothetical protein